MRVSSEEKKLSLYFYVVLSCIRPSNARDPEEYRVSKLWKRDKSSKFPQNFLPHFPFRLLFPRRLFK